MNGRSLGRRKRGSFEYRFRWDEVVYEPGELRVETWKQAEPWASETIETTGDPVGLSVIADRSQIHADCADLCYLTVQVIDSKGRLAPRANNLLEFELLGPAEIVAVDNGDPTSHVSFRATQLRAFNGLCLVVVRSLFGEKGKVRIHVRSKGLNASATEIDVS